MPTVTVDLTPDQLSHVRDALASSLSELRAEISGTDRLAFREQLREREQALQALHDAAARAGEEASADMR
jgi:hypothetical protein